MVDYWVGILDEVFRWVIFIWYVMIEVVNFLLWLMLMMMMLFGILMVLDWGCCFFVLFKVGECFCVYWWVSLVCGLGDDDYFGDWGNGLL